VGRTMMDRMRHGMNLARSSGHKYRCRRQK
jgi:hypothetical protein